MDFNLSQFVTHLTTKEAHRNKIGCNIVQNSLYLIKHLIPQITRHLSGILVQKKKRTKTKQQQAKKDESLWAFILWNPSINANHFNPSEDTETSSTISFMNLLCLGATWAATCSRVLTSRAPIVAIQCRRQITNLVPLPLHDVVAELGGRGVFQSAARFLHKQVHCLTVERQRQRDTQSCIDAQEGRFIRKTKALIMTSRTSVGIYCHVE